MFINYYCGKESLSYHLILWGMGGGILNKKEGNNRPLLSLSFFFFSKNLFNFFGGFSLNHRSDFRASKMEKTLAVHVVGSKDELEKSAFGKSVNIFSIPGIFNDFFHFHTSNWLGNFCRLFAFVVFQVFYNKLKSSSVNLLDLNFRSIGISFKDVRNEFALLCVIPLEFQFLGVISRADQSNGICFTVF